MSSLFIFTQLTYVFYFFFLLSILLQFYLLFAVLSVNLDIDAGNVVRWCANNTVIKSASLSGSKFRRPGALGLPSKWGTGVCKARDSDSGGLQLTRCTGATTAEKLRGTKVWVPTPGRLRLRPAPGQRPGWGWVREEFAPSRCGGPAVSPPENFLKTQMLNPAFWWLLRSLVGPRGRVYPSKQQACQYRLQCPRSNWCGMTESHWELRSNNTCCEISCFLKTTVKKLGGTNTLLVLQPKSWGTSLPRSPRSLRLCTLTPFDNVLLFAWATTLYVTLSANTQSVTGSKNPRKNETIPNCMKETTKTT